MYADLQRLTAAALLPPAYAAEIAARTAAHWAEHAHALIGTRDATDKPDLALPAPVDLIEIEAEESQAAEVDLVARAVETTASRTETATVNLLDAVGEATDAAIRKAETSVSAVSEAPTSPTPLAGKPFAAE